MDQRIVGLSFTAGSGTLTALDRRAVDTNVLQTFMSSIGIFCPPAFWQNALYFAGSVIGAENGDRLKRLTFNSSTGQLSTSPHVRNTVAGINRPDDTVGRSPRRDGRRRPWKTESEIRGRGAKCQNTVAEIIV